jgi:hypothetical protein
MRILTAATPVDVLFPARGGIFGGGGMCVLVMVSGVPAKTCAAHC